MSLRYKLSVVLVLILVVLCFLGFVSTCLSQPAEKSEAQTEGTAFRFSVHLKSIDWSAREFDVYVEIDVDASPYNLSYPLVPFFQPWYEGAFYVSKQSGTAIPLSSSGIGPGPPYSFRGNVTTGFPLTGPTQLYPFDRYILNLTFVLPLHVSEWNVSASSIVNQNNTWFNLVSRAGEFDCTHRGEEPKFSSITYELSTASEGGEVGVEYVTLSSSTFLYRPSSSTDLIMTVLGICYLLVGSLPLIKPDRLEYRLSVCLSLFVFAVTFTFAISVPTFTGATLAETLILVLLTAAGLFSVVSIIEKALIEVKQRLAVSQYFVEGLILWVLILNLGQSLFFIQGTNQFKSWASIPSTLFILLSIALFYGYAAVTLAFIINLVRRNKSRISKRLGAIRSLGRQHG
jgi:hypothetical protein